MAKLAVELSWREQFEFC